MLLAAARRFLVLLAAASAAILAVSALLGALLDAELSRAVSLGFYCVGAFLLVAGFFSGNRGPVRLRGQPGDEGPWGFGRRQGLRTATPEERRDSMATAAIFVALGFALILLGVAADGRYSLA